MTASGFDTGAAEALVCTSSMKAGQHIACSGILSGALYLVCPSPEMAVASFLAGVLIDIDHCVDYVIEFGFRPDWHRFFRSFEEGQYTRIYIVFHGWEWLPVLGLMSWLTGYDPFFVGALFGVAQHLILDQLTNGASSLGYSLLWRWSRGFAPNLAFPYKGTPFQGK